MHSERRYKICTCSVILGELEPFRNYKGYNIIFPKNLEAIYAITKVGIFLIPLYITFLNPKILGSLFCIKNGLTWAVKCEKKVKGNLLDKLRKLYVHKRNGHLEIFSRPQVIENSRQYFLLRRDIHRKKYLGAPGTIWVVKSKRRHHIITIRAGCSSSRN